jgi:hypothetical protein
MIRGNSLRWWSGTAARPAHSEWHDKVKVSKLGFLADCLESFIE